jgi:hypothetical protein
MANLKMMLSPMVKMVDWVNKLVQRQVIHLLPGLNEKIDKIQSKKVRTGHRGPYNVSGRTWNREEIVSILDEETSADKEVDGYFRTLSNFLLPNELQDTSEAWFRKNGNRLLIRVHSWGTKQRKTRHILSKYQAVDSKTFDIYTISI